MFESDFWTAGIYSPNAYRGFAREFIKDLERIRFQFTLSLLHKNLSLSWQGLYSYDLLSLSLLYYEHLCRPRAILDIIKSGEDFRISTSTKMPEQGTCERCGYISSQVCFALILPDKKTKLPIWDLVGDYSFYNYYALLIEFLNLIWVNVIIWIWSYISTSRIQFVDYIVPLYLEVIATFVRLRPPFLIIASETHQMKFCVQ